MSHPAAVAAVAAAEEDSRVNMSFEFTIGDLTTTTPWQRPDRTKLNAWYDDFQEVAGFSSYTILAGDALFTNPDTWDADIIVTGSITTNTELRNLLREGMRLGFEHEQLVDIFYIDNVFTYRDGFSPFYKLRTWQTCTKTENGVQTLNHNVGGTQVINGLYKVQYNEPTNSYQYWRKMYAKNIYPNARRALSEVLDGTA